MLLVFWQKIQRQLLKLQSRFVGYCHKVIFICHLSNTEDGKYVDDVIATGVVSSFVKFLSYDNLPELQFESVWALTNIASGTSQQVVLGFFIKSKTAAVVNAGSIDPILRLLSSTKLEVQEQAVWALGNISGDCDEYRQMILQRNGFSIIVAFAQQNMDKIGVIKNCIWCLSNLCRNPKRDSSQFPYIQPHLVFLQRLLNCNMPEVVADACWAFCFLTEAKSEQKKEVLSYINPNYLLCLILYDDIHLQSPALRLAGNFVSGDQDDTQVMLNAGLLRVLVILLGKAQELQKKEVLWILSNITAGTTQQITQVINMGFIKYLINVANTESIVLQTEAIWALCNAINGGTVEQVYIIRKNFILDTIYC